MSVFFALSVVCLAGNPANVRAHCSMWEIWWFEIYTPLWSDDILLSNSSQDWFAPARHAAPTTV